MKKQIAKTIIALLIGSTAVQAATHYVDINNTSPTAPYTNWVTAATNIQNAVDAAVAGETVLVTNGTYQLNAEVLVPESLRIEGVGVVAETIVVAVNSNRCFNLAAGVFLSGVTITNGYAAVDGGGILCADESAMISNCVISGNTAGDDGGGMYRGTAYGCDFIGNTALDDAGGAALVAPDNCMFIGNTAVGAGGGYSSWASPLSPSNCVFIGNTAKYGGATYESEAYDCVFSNNIAGTTGGAMYQGSDVYNCVFAGNVASNKSGGAIYRLYAYNCFFTNNWAKSHGGAIFEAGASNCTFISNHAGQYGGAKAFWNGVMQDCVFISNTAGVRGGAVNDGQLYNCIFYGNHSYGRGGAVYEADLYNCVLYNNSANDKGGGIYLRSARNSIIWSNSAPSGNDLYNLSAYHCCLSDTVISSGTLTGCITNAPLFVDTAMRDFHLQAGSPCIDSGSNALTHAAFDFDGVPRPLDGDNNGSAIIDIGCYELLVATADSDDDAMPDGWEHDHGLNAAVADASGNPDLDPHDNLSEYIAGTDPANGASFFQITNAADTAFGFVVEWAPSVSNREYAVLHEGSLTNSLTNVVSGIDFPQNSHADTTHSAESEGFYRVEVKLK